MPFAVAVLTGLLMGQDGALKPRDFPPKTDERSQFHLPDVTAMPTRIRLDAHAKRMKMRADSPFAQIPWRNVGPEVQGGRVVDIAVPRSNLSSIYVGFATGGLWRTNNEGQTWTSLFDDQSTYGIGDFDITADGKTIWLGSGEANSQRTSYAGTGVFVSRDSGATWTNMGLHESHHIGRVVIDPKNAETVYVAALGPLYSQGGDRGLFKTTDGGKTWRNILPGSKRSGCMDIAIDPRNSNVLYASMWERDRRAWNLLESGPDSAVYKSTDAGKTWTKLSGLPNGMNMGRTALAIAPSRPDTVYAFIDNQGPDDATGTYDEFRRDGVLTLHRFRRMSEAGIKKIPLDTLTTFLRPFLPQGTSDKDTAQQLIDGKLSLQQLADLMLKRDPTVFDKDIEDAQVWRSDDAGKTWVKTRADMGNHGGYYWNEIKVNPRNHLEVYTLGVLLYKSVDGGASWNPIARRNHVDHHAMWFDPENPNRMLNGNDGGIYVSYDAGDSWNHWNNLAVGQFTTIAVDDKLVYNIIGGLQDNGTMIGPSNYRFGFSNPESWKAIGGGDGSAIQVDPRNGGDVVYIASQFGAHSGFDQVNNRRWQIAPRARTGEPPLRFNWISPILISAHHPDVIYLGSQKLHRSFDMGRTFEDLSGDLTKNIPNGDVPHSSLTVLSESPFKFGRIYAGADDGSLKYTPDSGETWRDISTPAKDRWVTRVVASKYAPGRVYVSQNGYRQDEWTPYVWVSEDFGATWKSIAANLPFEPVNTVREDPTNENILYVGTDMGVYVSLDRGASWITYGQGLMNTPVHDLVIQPKAKEMVIASHARSVWVTSVDFLYKVTPEIRGKEFHSFKLEVPSGRDDWGYERSNPAQDAIARDRNITTEIWTTQSGVGKLELLDANQKAVVTSEYTFTAGYQFLSLPLLLKAGDPRAPGVFGNPDDPAEALKDPFKARRADYVAKGDYTLRLTIAGKVFDQKVTIR